MALPDFTQTAAQAESALMAEGFAPYVGASGRPLWSKLSRVDDFAGGYQRAALVEIEPQSIAPEYGGGQFYRLRFLA